ncbi:MAG: ABC transporter ATP-binding protein [Thalassotalea sp.]
MKLASDTILKVTSVNKEVQVNDKSLSILQNIDLEVNAGETLAIVGASGSGKSTLLSLIAGLDIPTSGEIYLKQQPLHKLNEEQRSAVRASHVGFIFQQFLLINSLTALENIMLPAELANIENAEAKARDLLAKVDLSERADHFPAQLSGGEQQRVAIARAFISQPAILFADEPTGNLDATTGKIIEDLLFDIHQQLGTTLILVTHDLTLAKRCAKQVSMNAGQLSAITAPHAINEPANLVEELA